MTAPFDFAPLLAPGTPPPAVKWNGFPKYNFIGGHNDAKQVPVDALIAAATAVLRREGATLATYGLNSGPLGYRPLREFLSSDPSRFALSFAEKLMMYSVNRPLEYSDMPQVRAVVRGAAKENYTLSSIVQGIVRSDAFLKQGPVPAPKAAGTKVGN